MKLISILLFICFTGSVHAQDVQDKIIGDWKDSSGRSILTIYRGIAEDKEDPDLYYGKLTWFREPNEDDGTPKLDKNNPKPSLRSQPLNGLVILSDLEWDGDNDEWEWGDADIYDPESGKTYSFQAEIDPKDPDKLEGRGFLGFSLLGRTEVWTRVE